MITATMLHIAARMRSWIQQARMHRARATLLRDIEALDRATLNDMGVTRPELIARTLRTCHG
ncbi:MAG: hypothetical protein AAF415_02920 [Pseudomonadota bacterium]